MKIFRDTFDEKHYLDANPDVLKAVKAGKFDPVEIITSSTEKARGDQRI